MVRCKGVLASDRVSDAAAQWDGGDASPSPSQYHVITSRWHNGTRDTPARTSQHRWGIKWGYFCAHDTNRKKTCKGRVVTDCVRKCGTTPLNLGTLCDYMLCIELEYDIVMWTQGKV